VGVFIVVVFSFVVEMEVGGKREAGGGVAASSAGEDGGGEDDMIVCYLRAHQRYDIVDCVFVFVFSLFSFLFKG